MLVLGLGRRGNRVLLIDIDSQANSSKILLPHYQQMPIRPDLTVLQLDRDHGIIDRSRDPEFWQQKKPTASQQASKRSTFCTQRERRDSLTHAYKSGDLLAQTNCFRVFARILANTA